MNTFRIAAHLIDSLDLKVSSVSL